jgi:nuclear GTP-binding protein
MLPQEVTIDADGTAIRFIDTPGIAWSADLPEDEALSLEGLRARDILLRSRGRIDRLKDPSSTSAFSLI